MRCTPDHRTLDTLRLIDKRSSEAYLVGGVIRDALMGRAERRDFDLAVAEDGYELAQTVAGEIDAAATFVPLDRDHGAGRIVLTADRPVTLDISRFRESTIEGDLRARDFSINAIAVRLGDFLDHGLSPLVDPCDGRSDIASRTIRMCGPASFGDDPLRIIRAFRFSANLGFSITRETLEAVAGNVSGLERIAPERIRDEFMAILNAEESYPALFEMDRVGAIDTLFPELTACKGVEQNPYHHLDVWGHTLEATRWVDRILTAPADYFSARATIIESYADEEIVAGRSRRALLKLAALFHDCGKPAGRTVDKTGRARFIGHEKVSRALFQEVGERLRAARREIGLVGDWIGGHMRSSIFLDGEPGKRAMARLYRAFGREVIGLLILFLADLQATQGPERSPDDLPLALRRVNAMLDFCFEAEEEPPRPLLTGTDLLEEFDLSSGPLIGRVLEHLWELQAEGTLHTREDAIAEARRYLSEGWIPAPSKPRVPNGTSREP